VNGSRGVVEGFTETTPALPLVLFKGHSEAIPITPMSWESDEIEGVKREQMPLIHAWAVTLHRSQGATLDCALVDLGSSTFEMGQAYVALSRVKSLESLYIYELDPAAFKANKRVVEYYRSLTPQEQSA
jgi:ATP-dependent DNA helicase PIF1